MERLEEYEELITELEGFEKSFINMAKDVREADQRLSYSFFKYSDVCRKAAEELKRMRPVEAEIERAEARGGTSARNATDLWTEMTSFADIAVGE